MIETRRHWMILMPPVLKSIGIVTIGLFFLSNDPYSMVLDNIVILAIVATAAYLTYQLLQWRMDNFVVTNRRVLLVSGVLTKKTAIMPLSKVTDMTYEQTPLARLLSYGTFIFESAGQDQALSRVSHLPGGPRQLYLQISALLFANDPWAVMPVPPRTRQWGTADERTGRPPGDAPAAEYPTTPIPRPPGADGGD